MKIKANETEIVGNWVFDGSQMISDDQCKRIDWLRGNYLKLISTDSSGWLNLYQDPEDGRYWQLQFRYGHMQGGGPPSLITLSETAAKEQYDLT